MLEIQTNSVTDGQNQDPSVWGNNDSDVLGLKDRKDEKKAIIPLAMRLTISLPPPRLFGSKIRELDLVRDTKEAVMATMFLEAQEADKA